MAKLTRQQFAEKSGVSKPGIIKALQSGKIVEDDEYRIDTTVANNRRYMNSEHVYSTAQKNRLSKTKSRSPATRRQPKRKKILAKTKGGSTAGKKKPPSLYDKKLNADIDLKKAQTRRIEQARARELGILIEREIMERKLAIFGAEIKLRLLDLPRRISQRITATIQAGGTAREIEDLLDKEIADILKHCKEATQRADIGNII